MKCRRVFSSCLFSILFVLVFIANNSAQDRQRIVTAEMSNQTARIAGTVTIPTSPTKNPASRPLLTNEIRVVTSQTNSAPLVKKTVSSAPVNSPSANLANNSAGNYSAVFSQRLMHAMQSRVGIPYIYGSDGPRSYDCSGLVWSVFQDAGLPFTRTSAANYFRSFEPVYGEDRYKFGTLVFFNGLGHVGIVIDENTFYQASSSKGVTFSKFAGYWEKRIVGFRRIPVNFN